MRKKLTWIIIVSIIIIISIVISFKVKSSFIIQPSLTQLKDTNCRIQYVWMAEEDYNTKYPEINDTNDLEKNSEIIVKVKSLDDGESAAYSLIRKCKVVNSFKGNIRDEIIYIYEPSYPSGNNYWCQQGYIAMEKDEEYIVFLNKIENSEYAKNKELSNGYVFTNPYVSKYKLGLKATTVDFMSKGGEVYYKDVSSLPMLFDDKKYADFYNKILSDIEKQY